MRSLSRARCAIDAADAAAHAAFRIYMLQSVSPGDQTRHNSVGTCLCLFSPRYHHLGLRDPQGRGVLWCFVVFSGFRYSQRLLSHDRVDQYILNNIYSNPNTYRTSRARCSRQQEK